MVRHPVPSVYVIVEEPGVTPVTTPDPDPTVATAVVPLAHVPLPASLKVAEAPVQTDEAPVITDGNGLTVIVLIAIQPVANV